jgi:hypothetical protein
LVEYRVWDAGVLGSSPSTPTSKQNPLQLQGICI